MAVPKKKMSRSRTRQRKAAWKLTRPSTTPCPQCGAAKATPPGLRRVRHLQRAGGHSS